MTIQEIHGIENARRIAMLETETQRVTVTDRFEDVALALGTSSFPAGLTPLQARMLAAQLIASAKRVEAAMHERSKAPR